MSEVPATNGNANVDLDSLLSPEHDEPVQLAQLSRDQLLLELRLVQGQRLALEAVLDDVSERLDSVRDVEAALLTAVRRALGSSAQGETQAKAKPQPTAEELAAAEAEEAERQARRQEAAALAEAERARRIEESGEILRTTELVPEMKAELEAHAVRITSRLWEEEERARRLAEQYDSTAGSADPDASDRLMAIHEELLRSHARASALREMERERSRRVFAREVETKLLSEDDDVDALREEIVRRANQRLALQAQKQARRERVLDGAGLARRGLPFKRRPSDANRSLAAELSRRVGARDGGDGGAEEPNQASAASSAASGAAAQAAAVAQAAEMAADTGDDGAYDQSAPWRVAPLPTPHLEALERRASQRAAVRAMEEERARRLASLSDDSVQERAAAKREAVRLAEAERRRRASIDRQALVAVELERIAARRAALQAAEDERARRLSAQDSPARRRAAAAAASADADAELDFALFEELSRSAGRMTARRSMEAERARRVAEDATRGLLPDAAYEVQEQLLRLRAQREAVAAAEAERVRRSESAQRARVLEEMVRLRAQREALQAMNEERVLRMAAARAAAGDLTPQQRAGRLPGAAIDPSALAAASARRRERRERV